MHRPPNPPPPPSARLARRPALPGPRIPRPLRPADLLPVRPPRPQPQRWRLPDGSVLDTPEPTSARDLKIGTWIECADRPRKIVDMRACPNGDRILHLGGVPLRVPAHAVIRVYVVQRGDVRP